MKSVYIMTDLEGVAGVVSFEEQAYSQGRYYEQAMQLLTAEVNASVEGLLEAGVERIVVADGHGPGAICYEQLHEKAELIHGRPITAEQMRKPAEDCDAGIIIGQHAMAGTADGNLNHTQNSREIEYIKLNKEPIGEIAQFALELGAIGLPLIFVSGDDAACLEAQKLIPDITTACVKKGLGRNTAISLSAVKSRRRIHDGVVEAVKKHEKKPISPLKVPGPYVLEKRFFHTGLADQAASEPGVERLDAQTVRFCGESITDVLYR